MIDYMKNAPKGYCGDPRRGAALGRRNILGEDNGSKFVLRKVRINSGGYDNCGTYWGLSDTSNLYFAATENIEIMIWAKDRNSAKEQVREIYCEAKFNR